MTTSTSGRRWRRLAWIVPIAVVAAALVVFAARWLRGLPPVADFVSTYPGDPTLPAFAPVGLPPWLGWQHFLNALFLLLIVRSGWQVRTTARPPAYWSAKRRSAGGPPRKISVILWGHLALDVLWVLNGIVFIVLLFATGQWTRIVPTHGDVIPNALSAALQYASFDWPTENGWTDYNALQLLSYFVIVFIAAPVAILTGLRMSPFWPTGGGRVNRLYPIELARAVHFPTMLFFVLFVIVHVTLVFATGALRNLDHMYAARDDGSWWGVGIFAVSLVVMAAAWFATGPAVVRSAAALTGSVTRN
jgi:thiosulfate reductase cytochrome b subunit